MKVQNDKSLVKKGENDTKIAFQMFQTVKMKFRPQKQLQLPSKASAIMNKIQGILPSRTSNSSSFPTNIKSLKYLLKVSSDHFVIGNSNQIDMISLGEETKEYMDTEFYWHLNIGKPMDQLAICEKRNIIAIVSGLQLIIYKYDIKKPHSKPVYCFTKILKEEIQFLQFPQQSLLGCFFKKEVEIYSIGDEGIKRLYHEKYGISDQLILFQVPSPIDNSIYVFFIEEQKNSNIFTLWCSQLDILINEVKFSTLLKVYDIKNSLKKSLRIDNYSKQMFLMNLGPEILVFKKGYIVDNVNVNLKNLNSELRHIDKQLMIHLTDKKVDVYHFMIDLHAKPQKIFLRATDSLIVKKPQDSRFFAAVKLTQKNFAVFYQEKEENNKRNNGEIMYYIAATRAVPISVKIDRIFPMSQIEQLKKDENYRIQMCDIAYKMGLSTKDIFLELWNRTGKRTQEEYALLFSCDDYESIRLEVQKKLRKTSMSFREVMKVEQNCFDFLKEKVKGVNCSQKNIIEYISCHFFRRKLQLFKDIHRQKKKKELKQGNLIGSNSKMNLDKSRMDSEDEFHNNYGPNTLMINIQQYNRFKSLDIKVYLLELVNSFCLYKENVIQEIRIVMTSFKFVFRLHYEELLQDIITVANSQLVALMCQIPQLLPYNPKIRKNQEESFLLQGIWTDISHDEWTQSLYRESISTIDNYNVLNDFVNHVWFKRNWLSQHDLVSESNQTILTIQAKIRSNYIFYFFISKIFQVFPIPFEEEATKKTLNTPKHLIKTQSLGLTLTNRFIEMTNHISPAFKENILKKSASCTDNVSKIQCILQFMEKGYDKMPDHLRGRVFLYYDLFKFLETKNILPQNNTTFCSFLQLENPVLFQHFFKKQRNQKGILLKSIKPIFFKFNSKMFNDGLLQYFKSNISQISDLKYILNRINNEKMEFHEENKAMYEILVTAMLIKLKIGSDNDIPIDEVLIYIESIPLEAQQLKKKIEFIEVIKGQAAWFRKMKINMSLDEMMNNFEEVMRKMVIYEMEENNIWQLTSGQETKFMERTTIVLENVNNRKLKLYENKGFHLPFYEFTCRLLDDKNKIELCGRLLHDPSMCDKYSIDIETREEIVHYMYQYKFHQNPIYVDNQEYISELVRVLDNKYWRNKLQQQTIFPNEEQDDYWRLFIQNEMELAILLSNDKNKVTFPIGQSGGPPTIQEFSEILSYLSTEHILKLDAFRIYELISSMEKLSAENIPLKIKADAKKNNVTLHEIYETIILRLLELNELKCLPPVIRKLLNLQYSTKSYGIVYPILFIEAIINSNQLNIDCADLLVQSILYSFPSPIDLLGIIEKILNSHYRTDERKEELQQFIIKAKKRYVGFNKNNILFSDHFKDFIQGKSNLWNETYNGHPFNDNISKAIDFTMGILANNRSWFKKNITYRIIVEILCNEPYIVGKYLSLNLKHTNLRGIRLFYSYLSMEKIFDCVKLMELLERLLIGLNESEYNNKPLQKTLERMKMISINEQQKEFKVKDDEEDAKNQLTESIAIIRKKKELLIKKREDNDLSNVHDHSKEHQKRGYFFDDDDKEEYQDGKKHNKTGVKKLKILKEFNPKLEMKNMLKKKEVTIREASLEHNEPKNANIINSNNFSKSVRVATKTTFAFSNKSKDPFEAYKKKPKEESLINIRPANQLTPESNPVMKTELKVEPQHSLMLDEDSSMIYQSSMGTPNLRDHLQVKFQAKEHMDQSGSLYSSQNHEGLKFSFNQPDLEIKKALKFVKVESFVEGEPQQKKEEEEEDMPSPYFVHRQKSFTPEKNLTLPKINNLELAVPPKMENKSDRTLSNRDNNSVIQIDVDTSKSVEQSFQKQDHNKSICNHCFDIAKSNSLYFAEKTQLPDLKILEEIGQNNSLIEVANKQIKEMYQNKFLPLQKVLAIIQIASKKFPSLGLNPSFVEVYVRAQSIHKKYSLELPLRQIFTFEGLYLKEESTQKLFSFLQPQITPLLNEVNVYKIVKVVSLSLKMVKVENEIFSSYLNSLIVKYLSDVNSQNQNEKEKLMEYEIIQVMINKLKPQFLKEKMRDLFASTSKSQSKDRLVNCVVSSIGKRMAVSIQTMQRETDKIKNG